jgi:superfamily II DNA or RNA helicase
MDALTKLAALLPEINLQPHQERLNLEAQESPVRKILMHALGSGKSLTGIGVAEGSKLPYTFVAPASLRENAKKEISKFTDKKIPSSVLSYTQIARGDEVPNNSTLIYDEAHRLRNPRSQQTERAQELAEKARQVVLLTGTPIVNSPGDIAPLLSIARNEKISPEEFEHQFIENKKVSPGLLGKLRGIEPGEETDIKNVDELKALLDGHIDYYAPKNEIVPTQFEDHHIEMSPEQTRVYKAIFDELPLSVRWKIRNEFPLSRGEFTRLQAFLTGPRQVGLSTLPFLKDKDPDKAYSHSTKLQKAMELLQGKLQDPRTKALIFSNFIDAGLKPYSHALNKANIPHGMFYGALNDKQRKQLVDDYNSNKIRVALLGPAGAEGLSFKGTQLVQLLDPHWNNVRTRQQQGRGIRFDSHLDLPEDLQNVTVQRFISRLPLGAKDLLLQRFGLNREKSRHATDDYLRLMSQKKDETNKKFIDVLHEVGSRHTPTPVRPGHETGYRPLKPIPASEFVNLDDEKLTQDRNTLLSKLYNLLFGKEKKSEDLGLTDQSPIVKKQPSEFIQNLRKIKEFSDKRQWSNKDSMLIHMMTQYPDQWQILPDPKVPPKFVGVHHWPTGFKYHMPREYVPAIVYSDIRSRSKPPITINEEKEI